MFHDTIYKFMGKKLYNLDLNTQFLKKIKTFQYDKVDLKDYLNKNKNITLKNKR